MSACVTPQALKCSFQPATIPATARASRVASSISSPLADPHLLKSEGLPRGQNIEGRSQLILPSAAHDERMVLLVIIRIVDQDIEDHAAKQCHRCREAVATSRGCAVEAPDRHRVPDRQAYGHRVSAADLRLPCESHRCVLDQGGVRGLTIGELDNPLLAAHVEEGLWPRTARGGARGDEPAQLDWDRLVVLDSADELVDPVSLLQRWQWAEAPGQIMVGRSRNSQRAEAGRPRSLRSFLLLARLLSCQPRACRGSGADGAPLERRAHIPLERSAILCRRRNCGQVAHPADQPQCGGIESGSNRWVAPLQSDQRGHRAPESSRPFALGFATPEPRDRQILTQATKRLSRGGGE